MMQLHQATHIIYEEVTDVSSCIMAKKKGQLVGMLYSGVIK